MEPWFQLQYAGAPLPPPLLAEWVAAALAPELELPARNAFLPSDFGEPPSFVAPASCVFLSCFCPLSGARSAGTCIIPGNRLQMKGRSLCMRTGASRMLETLGVSKDGARTSCWVDVRPCVQTLWRMACQTAALRVTARQIKRRPMVLRPRWKLSPMRYD